VWGTLADIPRSRAELLAENALLRQQLIVLQRNTKTPRLTWRELCWLPLSSTRFFGQQWRRRQLICRPCVLVSSLKNAWDNIFAHTQLKMVTFAELVRELERLPEHPDACVPSQAVIVWYFLDDNAIYKAILWTASNTLRCSGSAGAVVQLYAVKNCGPRRLFVLFPTDCHWMVFPNIVLALRRLAWQKVTTHEAGKRGS
jgi:hypothetical protein